MTASRKDMNRRSWLGGALRWGGAAAIGALGLGALLRGDRAKGAARLWQIDPHKCIQCGNCATYCVLNPSAVKCVHSFSMCGYCELCTGYFEPQLVAKDTGAENQLCPVGAINRTYVEDPYFQYTIDEDLCIGCGKCVKGCQNYGNGSLYLQVMHHLCEHCNECAIAIACPSQAFVEVPSDRPYLLKVIPPQRDEASPSGEGSSSP